MVTEMAPVNDRVFVNGRLWLTPYAHIHIRLLLNEWPCVGNDLLNNANSFSFHFHI